MPIYEYLCNSCGAEKEHLQKISDAPITTCPVCGSNNYVKLISAAGFQLKGSGWYVTDFKNSNAKPSNAQSSSKDTKSDAVHATETKSSESSPTPEANTKKDSGSTSTPSSTD